MSSPFPPAAPSRHFEFPWPIKIEPQPTRQGSNLSVSRRPQSARGFGWAQRLLGRRENDARPDGSVSRNANGRPYKLFEKIRIRPINVRSPVRDPETLCPCPTTGSEQTSEERISL